MSEFTQASVEPVISQCQENIKAIAESLNLCFNRQYRLEIGESGVWQQEVAPAELDQPGLLVALQVGQQAMLCLIPESLPLPEWYTSPGDSEESRLQTLGMEWSLSFLPHELEAQDYLSQAVDNLKAEVSTMQPADWSAMLELRVLQTAETPSEKSNVGETEQEDNSSPDDENPETAAATESAESENPPEAEEETASVSEEGAAEADSDNPDSPEKASLEDSPEISEEATSAGSDLDDDSSQPIARLYLIWPVLKPPFATEEATKSAPSEEVAPKTDPFSLQNQSSQQAENSPLSQNLSPQEAARLRRLLKLPVTIIVRLAEKKIELGQLLSLTPGALITFNKSCEDLLDLYVNNQLYCQGEAVKIGEKFGLKINYFGSGQSDESKVLEA